MKKWLKRLLFVSGLVMAVLTAVGYAKYSDIKKELPGFETMKDYRPAGITRVYDRNGELFATFSRERRTVIPLSAMSKHLVNAFIAAEDGNFWDHAGVDWLALARCGLMTAKAAVQGGSRCGGSTITQQTVQFHLLTMEHTESNKLKKLILARAMEESFSKEEILHLYLNQIYFGNGAYGVEEAARTYFGKKASALTLAESATLAAIPKNPNKLNPFRDKEGTIKRRSYVLGQMVKRGLATPDQVREAELQKLARPKSAGGFLNAAPYAAEEIRRYLIGRYGETGVYRDGLVVHASIDVRASMAAETALKSGLEAVDERMGGDGKPPRAQGALVAIDPDTRQVRALVGGYEFDAEKSSLNRATQASRQPGSSFKPFVYAAAIESKGFTAASVIADVPKVFYELYGDREPWRPKNSDGAYRGNTRLRECLAHSVNICSVTLVEAVTPKKVVEVANRVGLGGGWKPTLSLALGTGEVTPLALANAYASFADQGRHADPILVRRVEAADGKVLESHQAEKRQAFDPAVAYVMLSIMRSVVETGTAQSIKRLGRPVSGKTGTTSEARDAWFVGCVPTLCTAVWVGRDDHEPLGEKEYGGRAAAPVWLAFNQDVMGDEPVTDFDRPEEGVETVEIDPKSGLLPFEGQDEETTIEEVFLAGTAPTEQAPLTE